MKNPSATDTELNGLSDEDRTDEYILIERTQHGDIEAFNPLVQRYQHRIYTHILGRIRNAETAKDLTQETWIKAFRAIKAFRGTASFYSWLYRLAENTCIDFFRKQKVEIDIEPLHTIDERRITDTHSSPCQKILRQELRLHLQNAIADLTTTRKQVFLLYYTQALPIKAIAARINRSEGTVKTHLRNARLQLQEYLTPYLKNEDIS